MLVRLGPESERLVSSREASSQFSCIERWAVGSLRKAEFFLSFKVPVGTPKVNQSQVSCPIGLVAFYLSDIDTRQKNVERMA